MARPRGEEWLEDEIGKFKKQNVKLLVSLLEQNEVSELGVYKEKEFCQMNNIAFITYPIVDRGIPKKGDELNKFIDQLTEKVKEGLSIVIHCRMGIGRSSIIAACVLLQAGLKSDEIIQKITKVRGLKVPDTDEQIRWLKDREKSERTT
jgi:protein-tyrosine phosphatase